MPGRSFLHEIATNLFKFLKKSNFQNIIYGIAGDFINVHEKGTKNTQNSKYNIIVDHLDMTI